MAKKEAKTVKIVEKDFEQWLKLAQLGDVKAQLKVGAYYYSIKRTKDNKEKAFNWFMEAAKQENARAQLIVGLCYSNGKGVEENKKEAFEWYKKAADRGDETAQFYVGMYYYKGKNDVEQNFEEAFKWFLRAAGQGNVLAQFNVGCCYNKGDGIKANKKEAFKWFLKAAEQGNVQAQFNVAGYYYNGEGVRANKHETFNWTLKAAEQGHVGAQFNVAVFYHKGEGVKANKKEAFKWYLKAAEQEHIKAQLKVGICYYEGIGVEKNIEEALQWLKKAAEQGNARAKSLLASYHKEAGKENNKKCDTFCKDRLETELSTALNTTKKEGLENLFSRLEEIANVVAEIKEKISSNTNIQIDPNKEPKAFVIMQFGEDFDELYEYVIKPTCKNSGYESLRADECYYASSIVLQDIVREIVNASLIIVDISMDNPNVFYELGYAHALNKPTILLADNNKRKKLPFDTQGYRTIFYKNSFAGQQELEKTLSKYMKNMQKSVSDKK